MAFVVNEYRGRIWLKRLLTFVFVVLPCDTPLCLELLRARCPCLAIPVAAIIPFDHLTSYH